MNGNKYKSGFRSFGYAFKGLAAVFGSEVNVRIHTAIAILVIILGLILGISRMEWLAVILCIGLVIGAEVFNSALERLVDIVSPQFNEKAGLVKDIAAGAVVVSALISVIIGVVIFIPYIKSFLTGL